MNTNTPNDKPIFISQAEAIALFSDPSKVNGGTFVSIDCVTIPKLSGGKANPMQGNVRKFNIGSQVMVFQNKNGSSYEAKVKRHMASEGLDPDNFVLSPRTWGERIPNTPNIHHNKDGQDKYYLEVIFMKSGAVSYKLNGQAIDKSEVQGLDKKEESQQGGQEKKVIIRTYGWDSIISFRLDKQSYIVTN